VTEVAPVRFLAQQIEKVPLGSIEPHPENPNQGDVGAIAESIEAVGFYEPILVQASTRRILSGEHRWRALSAQGAAEAPVVFLDVDDETAVRILIGANEIARRGSYPDEGRLGALLADLAQTTGSLLATGFDTADLDRLLADLSTDLSRNDGNESAQERYDAHFQTTEVRQVVLIMGVERFERSVAILRRMRETEAAIDTNTDAINALLDRWDAEHPTP